MALPDVRRQAPGKPGKKSRKLSGEDSSPVVVMPARAADPQKQILPLVLTLALPVEKRAEPDPDHKEPEQKGGRELNPSGAVLSGLSRRMSVLFPQPRISRKISSLPFAVNVAVPEEATSPRIRLPMRNPRHRPRISRIRLSRIASLTGTFFSSNASRCNAARRRLRLRAGRRQPSRSHQENHRLWIFQSVGA